MQIVNRYLKEVIKKIQEYVTRYDKTYHSQKIKNSAILVPTRAEFYAERNRPKSRA